MNLHSTSQPHNALWLLSKCFDLGGWGLKYTKQELRWMRFFNLTFLPLFIPSGSK